MGRLKGILMGMRDLGWVGGMLGGLVGCWFGWKDVGWVRG